MRSRISGRDSDDSVDTGRKLVGETLPGAESGLVLVCGTESGLVFTKINRWKQIWTETDSEDRKNPNGKSSRIFHEKSYRVQRKP